MKMSQLRYHTVQCSKITVDNAKVNLQNVYNLRLKQDSWGSYTATGSEITEGNNFPVIPIESEFTYDMITSFHQPGTGR